jgi:segregation and condensation protein B
LGRPLLYGTTRKFLELFGLADLANLPLAEQLRHPTHTQVVNPGPPTPPDQM